MHLCTPDINMTRIVQLNSICRIELVESSSPLCLPLLQAAAVFKTSYELVMFMQNNKYSYN